MHEYLLSSTTLWKEFNHDLEDKGGAYKLICRDNGQVQPIGRFLGIDKDGVLYIGKAFCYLDRVIGLKKTIDEQYKSTPHIGGRRYNRSKNVRIKFPYRKLYIQLFQSDNPIKLERQFLNEYLLRFGEVPPLNANG